jgi:hypothetical protein
MLPGKKAIVSGLIAAAVFMVIYNKVPAVRRILGAAA